MTSKNNNQIKEAFRKVKKEMDFLRQEINKINKNLIKFSHDLYEISQKIGQINQKTQIKASTHPSTDLRHSFDTSTDNSPFKTLKSPNYGFSIGNEGVSTLGQQTGNRHSTHNIQEKEDENTIERASEIIHSLNGLKQEIKDKFNSLTDQEFLVFSTLYQTELEGQQPNYNLLAQKLNVTESTIRDYISRIIRKGVPVEKKKLNNKRIVISISESLKKIATLPSLIQLREI